MQSKILIFTAIFIANLCYAEEQDTELQNELHFLRLENFLNLELDIASTKAETSLQSPSTVTVIDRQMLEEYNFASISTAVETLAGIQIYRTAFKQQVTTIRGVLQDHYANKVLVMINNIPSWHAITGEGNLDRLSIHDVERIEVLRGPASVIYGSQAYSGAVNIILRKDTKQLHTSIGNKDRNSIGANYRYNSKDKLSIFTAANKEHGQHYQDNFTDEAGINGNIEDYHDSLNATAALEYQDHSLLFNVFRNDEGNYEGSTQKFSAGAGNNHDVDGILLGYTYSHNWNQFFYSKMKLFYDQNERNFSRSADDDIRANVLGQRVGGNISNIFTWDDKLQFELGTDYEIRTSKEYKNIQHSTVLTENNLSDRSVYEYSGYAQIDWKPLAKWRILIGSRLTKSETFGENISSRGTIVYSIDANNTVKFIAGQSFRTPSLFELYFITPTKSVFGTESLEPETADTFEIGYQHSHNYIYIQALAYYSIYQNKIHRIKDDVMLDDGTIANNVSVYTNGQEFSAKGVELELKYLNPKVANIFLNFAYISGDDGDKMSGTEHYNFKYVPDFTTSIGVHKNIQGIDISVIGNYSDTANSHQESVDSYFNLSFNLAYQHKYKSLQLKHILSVQNLTDTQVAIPEYVRRGELNELPLVGTERGIFYSLLVDF